jgi:hypothetical protein
MKKFLLISTMLSVPFTSTESEATNGVLFVQPSGVVVQNHVFVPRSTQFFAQSGHYQQQSVIVQNVQPVVKQQRVVVQNVQPVVKQQRVVIQNVQPSKQINIRSGLFGGRNTTINVR